MEEISRILFYPLIDQEGFVLAPINLLIFIFLFLLGKIILTYLKKLFKSPKLVNKKFTVEGKEIPIWRLTRQFLWLIILLSGVKSLEVTNPDLASSHILMFEFVRFKNFHIAVYHLFVLLFILFFSRILLNLIQLYLSRRIKTRESAESGSMYVYLQLTKYIIITLAIIFMLRSMGVDLNLFITSMAFLLVGLGLGLQDIFRDFFAGLLLLFEGSIKVGDIVEIDRPKEENFIAKIIEINMRTSKVETRDSKLLIVPNSQLSFQSVNNWSSGRTATRFMIPVTVSYNADLELVKKLMVESAAGHSKVLQGKDVIVRLRDFGDHGYKLDLVFWANQNFYIDIHKSDIRFAMDKAFKENGVEYPYNQLDVHMIPEHKKPNVLPDNSEDAPAEED